MEVYGYSKNDRMIVAQGGGDKHTQGIPFLRPYSLIRVSVRKRMLASMATYRALLF